jgi:hypothetical protein
MRFLVLIQYNQQCAQASYPNWLRVGSLAAYGAVAVRGGEGGGLGVAAGAWWQRECSGKVGLVVRFRRPWRQQILLFKGAEQIAFDGTHLTPARSSVAHAIYMHYIIYITQHL